MPGLDDIKRFNEILKSLGKEQEILAQRSEKIEDVPEPEQRLPGDLSALLSPSNIEDENFLNLTESPGDETSPLNDFTGIDNLDDFMMPSMDTDDSDSKSDESGGFDFQAENSENKAPLTDFPGIDDFSFSGDEAANPADEFKLPESGGGGIQPDESTSIDDFSFLDNETSTTSDEFEIPGQDLKSPDDLSFPDDEAGGQPDEFKLPESGDGGIQPDESASIDDFSFLDNAASTPADEFEIPGQEGESLDDFSFTGDDLLGKTDEFSLPGGDITDQADEFSLPDKGSQEIEGEEFSFPDGDLSSSLLGDKGVADEFSIPDEFAQPPGEPLKDDFSTDEFTIDDFAIDDQSKTGDEDMEDFSIPGQDRKGDDEFSLPDDFKFDSSEKAKVESDELDNLGLDDFALPGSLKTQEKPAEKAAEKPAKRVPGKAKAAAGPQLDFDSIQADSFDDIKLTEKQFENLKKTMDSLPRNLKLICQDIISQERLLPKPMKAFIDLFITGASPVQVAKFITDATGDRITLPKSFEKKSGIDFEEEQKSLAYQFRVNILPILKVFIPAVLLLVLLVAFVINIIIIPSNADALYKKGLYYINTESKFNLADETFDKAYELRPVKDYFYKYAEAFAAKNRFSQAQRKYEQLLNLTWDNEKIKYLANLDSKGIVDYANMESKRMYNFAKAETLLNYLLDHEKFNKQGLLAAGDNYLEWAKEDFKKLESEGILSSTDKYKDWAKIVFDEYQSQGRVFPETTFKEWAMDFYSKYELARLSYARIQRSKDFLQEEFDFRFLKYFIRTDNYEQALDIMGKYQQSEKTHIDPVIYTELGGYLLDKGKIEEARAVLLRAMKVKKEIPELHYNLARYFNKVTEPGDEETALLKTINYLKDIEPLNTQRKEMKIDVYNRLGKLYYNAGKFTGAEIEFRKAITMIEDGQDNEIFAFKPLFGDVFYNTGNIAYYIAKDYETAFNMFSKAEKNKFKNPDLDYKMGFMEYRNKKYLNSLNRFHDAEKESADNINILYSLGNTFFHRNDFFAAQGYFLRLIEILEKEKDKIKEFVPENDIQQRNLINYLVRTYNNLGVTMKRLAERPRNPKRETQALVYINRAVEYYDLLKRAGFAPGVLQQDKVTKTIPELLNQKSLIYPAANSQLIIYNDIPGDLKSNQFNYDLFEIF